MPPDQPRDLTAILLPLGQHDDEQIRRLVFQRGYGDVLVRVAPLTAVQLTQVEVHDARRGLPCEDPELVAQLSKGGWAAFVHVNHSAKQAIVHAFTDGQPQPGFAGEPGEAFDQKLAEALEKPLTLPEVHAADDGSRLGIGVASSRTVGIVRGGPLLVPAGTPTEFDSFHFHDRGLGLDEEDERLAFLAFDERMLRILWGQSGKELAATLGQAPARYFGPLEDSRPQVLETLAALGDQSPAQASLTDLRTLELATMAVARAFAGGDTVSFWDERVLPMFSLATSDPVIDPAEVDDLDSCDSLLHAMVEVQPYAAPPDGEGNLLSSIGDAELAPLAPWVKPGEVYQGTIFLLGSQRLLPLVRSLDGQKLRGQMERFERAWYRAARPGQPEGDAFETFRRAHAEEGQKDIERFVRDWTELRICLEVANANQLKCALLFYEGAA